MELNYWYAFIALVIFLNTIVSFSISKRDDLDTIQKSLQILIVWLLPLIASIGFWLFHKNQDDDNKPSGCKFGGGPKDSIGVSSSGD
ncbi:hypothetical protein L4D06_25170 [Enterovibrio makurazakiensis]|uniref:hypothetical protein n=1 Tax=Enterovibrio makurazakiensis TaxID=2910232 RepID=UPI003D1B4E0D